MPKVVNRSSQKIKKVWFNILKASGFIERDTYCLMKTLLVLNRKLCCSKWGKKVSYFFLLFSLSQVFICWGNKTQCSPKGNSADLPMVAGNRNFRCLRSAWVTEVCNVKLIIRIKDSWLVMRARKNNYMIIIECIESGTEITTTEWLRINLISCSKGMEKSGKSCKCQDGIILKW